MQKLSKSDIRNIIRLRKSGMMIKLIAEMFGVCEDMIEYHIYPKLKESRKKYIKKYIIMRYRTDENFRRRHLISVRKYQKNSKKYHQQHKKYAENHREYFREKSRLWRLKQKKRQRK